MTQPLVEGSEGVPLSALIAARDWSDTPIGPPEGWPQSLQTAMGICLESRFPILIWWGPELVMLYNDAYAPLIGTKHPAALGQRGADCFPEIWHIIGPMLEGVRASGEATWSDDQLLELNRRGFPEECYFTFSYSPIRDESGGIGGVFTAVAETTNRVIGERRLRILRDLGAATVEAKEAEDACLRAAAALAGSVGVPFSLFYLFDAGAAVARLVAASDPPGDEALAPPVVSLAGGATGPWPLVEIREGADALEVDARPLTRRAVVLPISHGGTEPAGAIVLGTSDRQPIDGDYRAFLSLVARQVSTAVTEARAREQERRRAEELAELDRAKTMFFTNVSHELRTPLTLILSPLEELLAELGDEPGGALRSQLELIRRNALRLLRLVNALLDFTRAESSRIDALFQPTDLAAVTADLAEAFRPAIEAAGLTLDLDCPPLPEPVYVDREAWEKVVLNLLSNALKFTFAGSVRVALHADGAGVELRVADTGAGIPEDELPRLFERFHQVRDVPSRSHEGSGIGLALVRELTELHGGSIAVESRLGDGSTFVVRLLPGRDHLPPEQVGGPEGTAARSLGATPYLEEALRWLPEEARPEDFPAEPVGLRDDLVREAGVERHADARILIADDNADMRGYLARLLRRYWDVETAADGAEAIAAIRRRPPDLVLSDVMMPNVDGFELLRVLRGDPATSGIPIVLVSARAGTESAVEGLDRGADDYLVKPFSARELVARVRANLELSRLRVTLAQLEAVFDERARAEEVLAALPVAVVIVDRDGAVDLWNAAAARITGIAVQHAVGRTLDAVLPGFAALARSLESREGRPTTRPVEVDGRELWLSAISAVHGDGTLYAFQDATESVALERLRRDLVTTVSHELRTPVSSLYGAVATLARTDVELPETVRRELLDALRSQTERLSRIVDELVTVASLDAEAHGVGREDIDLSALVTTLVERFRPRAPAGLRLAVRVPAGPVRAALDAEKVEQALEALVDNAVRYTGETGEVEVTVERRAAGVRVSVRDTGPGIAEEHRPHIGERFFRADPDLGGGVPGLGLGLTIARHLVELMDGRLSFESTVGEGSTFVVDLPA